MRATKFEGTITEFLAFLKGQFVNKIDGAHTYVHKGEKIGVTLLESEDEAFFSARLFIKGRAVGNAIDTDFLEELINEETFDDCVDAIMVASLMSKTFEYECVSVSEGLKEKGQATSLFEVGEKYSFEMDGVTGLKLADSFFPHFDAKVTFTGVIIPFEDKKEVVFKEVV